MMNREENISNRYEDVELEELSVESMNRLKWCVTRLSEVKDLSAEKTTDDYCKIETNSCMKLGVQVCLHGIHDAMTVIHGPSGCASQQRYYWVLVDTIFGSSSPRDIPTTALNKRDIIMGRAELKLENTLREVCRNYSTNLVAVITCCVSGIICDDSRAVAKRVQMETGKKIIVIDAAGFSCRSNQFGFDAGLIALINEVMKPPRKKIPNSVNIFGEWARMAPDYPYVKSLLEDCGITVNMALISGPVTVADIERAPEAEFNLMRCESTAINAARIMKDRFGVPFVGEYIPYGIQGTKDWILSAAEKMEESVHREAKSVLERKISETKRAIEPYLSILKGKRAVLSLSQTKALWFALMLAELGMKPVLVGSIMSRHNLKEFAERVFNKIKSIDTDIDPLFINEINIYDVKAYLEEFQPDILLADMIERDTAYRLGIPFVTAMAPGLIGFQGVVRMAHEMAKALKSKSIKKMKLAHRKKFTDYEYRQIFKQMVEKIQ